MEIEGKNWIIDFLENAPPYKKYSITEAQLEEFATKTEISIEQFCEKCNKSMVFKYVASDSFKTTDDFRVLVNAIYNKNIHGVYYVTMLFLCQYSCDELHAISLRITNETIEKIGQFPSYTTNEIKTSLKKYKNIVPKYYTELTASVSAYSQRMGIAAFVYLRRIFEHLVDNKCKNYSIDIDMKFIDKLHALEKKEEVIPDELNSIKNDVYLVLSKGIHEYDEEQCLALYPAVKLIIETILNKELEKKEHKKQIDDATKAIKKFLYGRMNNNGREA